MRIPFLLLLTGLALFTGCGKETETYQTEATSAYLPATTGKYITYRVDSLVFINFGTSSVVRSYQEKHQVDIATTDNLGRPAFRVYRYLRDTAGTMPWRPSGSYSIVTLTNTTEVIENNLRFLKLTAPIKDENTWKGNRFLPADPYSSYPFGNDDFMDEWDYTYSNVGSDTTIAGKRYANTISIQQVDESVNVPVSRPNEYASLSFWHEKYAKGIGLIYQEVTLWEQQANQSGSGARNGFGVRRYIIDHN